MSEKQGQSGFTLIELVVVIVILGILAATALPKFIDLSADAKNSAVAGVAGGLAAASAMNYAARTANSGKGVPVGNCQDVSNAMSGGMPSGWAIASVAVSAGNYATCSITNASVGTTTFIAVGV